MSEVSEILGESGVMFSSGKYSHRPGQELLSSDMLDAMRSGSDLIAEAPTGAGKSMAIAVASMLYVNGKTERRVAIVTKSIELQNQMSQTLPVAATLCGAGATSVAVLKGYSNYLCKLKLKNATEGRASMSARNSSIEVSEWESMSDSGDMSVAFPTGARPRQFGVSSAGCVGSSCEFHNSCHARSARDRVTESQIVVVNVSLYAANQALSEETGSMPIS